MLKRELVRPSGIPLPHPTATPAVKFGPWVFVSGVMATDYETGLPPEVIGNAAIPLAGEHIQIRESRFIFQRLKAILDACGTDIPHAVRIDQFPTSRGMVDPYHVERKEVIKPPRPASTSVVIDGHLVPQANTMLELMCVTPESGIVKEGINTDKIPQPIGGYAPAIRAGDFVFVSGQVPSDFRTGLAAEATVHPKFWEGNAIDKETRFTLDNIRHTLEAAGSSMENIVKIGVYLTDMNDVPRLDRVWREYFPKDPPARTIFPIHSVVVPEARIEITVIAVTDKGATRKEVISTDAAPAPIFHESQAIRAGNLLFLSGQLAADAGGLAASARAPAGYPYAINGPAEQLRQIAANAQAICKAAGTDLKNTLRFLTLHTDIREYGATAEVRRTMFTEGEPASAAIAVPGPLMVPGCTITADLWVGIP